jgi:hypothetical protein
MEKVSAGWPSTSTELRAVLIGLPLWLDLCDWTRVDVVMTDLASSGSMQWIGLCMSYGCCAYEYMCCCPCCFCVKVIGVCVCERERDWKNDRPKSDEWLRKEQEGVCLVCLFLIHISGAKYALVHFGHFVGKQRCNTFQSCLFFSVFAFCLLWWMFYLC